MKMKNYELPWYAISTDLYISEAETTTPLTNNAKYEHLVYYKAKYLKTESSSVSLINS